MLVLISIYRVPQIMERLLPFSVLIGAMTCFFVLSRRMEFVVARAAGMSVWQIIAPASLVAFLLGVISTLVYNPVSATLREASKLMRGRGLGCLPVLSGTKLVGILTISDVLDTIVRGAERPVPMTRRRSLRTEIGRWKGAPSRKRA